MEIDIAVLLNENPMLLLFTVIGFGYLAGNLRVAGIQAGPVIGVLLIGLLFGHLGFKAQPEASSFGFTLFIFSVGIQAGSAFFGAFAADGVRYVTLSLDKVSFRLGTAGGLLIIGILIGYLGSVMPTFGHVPAPARFVLMEPGLMLFMGSVGVNAGGGVADALTSIGSLIILSGILVTLVPALVAYLVGRRLLGMNPALLLGSITGAMTSTPALNVVTDAARSAVPALGYAGTYTFANVLLTFAGNMILETAVDRSKMTETSGNPKLFLKPNTHPLGDLRYDLRCTSRAAPARVIPPSYEISVEEVTVTI